MVVLSGKLARKLFGPAAALGQTVRFNSTTFRVVGVLDDWHPQPAFYHQQGHGVYGVDDQFFMPLRTAIAAHMPFNGHLSCWGGSDDPLHSGQCSWLQLWVKLDGPAKVSAYRQFLDGYW